MIFDSNLSLKGSFRISHWNISIDSSTMLFWTRVLFDITVSQARQLQLFYHHNLPLLSSGNQKNWHYFRFLGNTSCLRLGVNWSEIGLISVKTGLRSTFLLVIISEIPSVIRVSGFRPEIIRGFRLSLRYYHHLHLSFIYQTRSPSTIHRYLILLGQEVVGI